MADKWVLTVTAQTPTNIAVIKYWGKRNECLILPINDIISVTLDPQHLCTTTSVTVSPAFTHDRMWLNGKGNVQPEAVLQTVSKTGKATSYWEATEEPATPESTTDETPAAAESLLKHQLHQN
ncbi:unnamed protein product [Fraxinus pennsylvanica]|uniref:Diphosphomevalonate decarboxylase-like N-terminal domain-containing protein n=1 Tax=Fraxinus pennsylvanica TaxID=56036 RepID=A0AAD1ZHT7_9LAMI|nr:unnamed protein product [Fraxinus pennsylvanica]